MAQCPDELMWSDGQGASCSEELVEWVLLLTEMKTVTVVSSSPLYDEWLQLCALKLPEVDFWYENQDFRVLFLSLSLKKISAIWLTWAFLMAQWVKNPPASAGDTGSIPGLGRSFREGNGNPLQYSCLTNPMDRGAWQSTICGVTKNWPWLSDWCTQACMCLKYLFWNQLHFSFWVVDSELEGHLWYPEWGQGKVEGVEYLKTPSWYSSFLLCPLWVPGQGLYLHLVPPGLVGTPGAY